MARLAPAAATDHASNTVGRGSRGLQSVFCILQNPHSRKKSQSLSPREQSSNHYNKAYADFANTHEKHAGGASTGGGTAGLAGVAGVGGREGSEGAAVEPPAGSTPPPRQRAT